MRHPRQPRRGSLTLPGGWSMVGQRPLAFDPLMLPGLRAYYLADQGASAWDVADLNGTSQYLGGSGSWLNGLTKLTLAGFVYTNANGTSALASQDDGSTQRCFILQQFSNSGSGVLRLGVASDLTTMAATVQGSQHVGAVSGQGSAAYHVAVVYDGTQANNADRVRLYVNGVLDPSPTVTGTIPTALTSSSASFLLGKDPSHYFPGQLWDWVAYAGVALTDAQVAALATVGAASLNPTYYGGSMPTLPGGNPSASHWWRLGETSDGTGAVSRADSAGSVTLTDNGNTPSFGLAGWLDLSGTGSHALSVHQDTNLGTPPVLATDGDGAAYWELDGTDTGGGAHACDFRCGKLGLSLTPAAWAVFAVLHVYDDVISGGKQWTFFGSEVSGGYLDVDVTPACWGYLEPNDFEYRFGSLTTAGGGTYGGSPAVCACNSGYHELPAPGRYLVTVQQIPGEPGQRIRVNGSEWAMRNQGNDQTANSSPFFWGYPAEFQPLTASGGNTNNNFRIGQLGDWDYAAPSVHSRMFALAVCAPAYPSTASLTDDQIVAMERFLAAKYGLTINGSAVYRPRITSISPTTATTGQTLTINGSGFTGATGVRFGGPFKYLQSSITVVSDSQITCTIPSDATTGQVAVVGPGGEVSSPTVLTLPIPVSSFSPSSGGTGTSVTLHGDTFYQVTGVSFNGVATSLTSPPGPDNCDNIVVAVPASATTGPISVTNAAGTTTTASNFTCTGPAVTSFSPTSGHVGDSIVITGVNFTSASSVKFAGTSASYSVDSSTQITATVPAGAADGTIAVVTPNGNCTSASSFTVIGAPQIASFSPTSGNVGASVTLTGSSFTGTTSVKFNGVSASFSVVDDTTITATVPTTTSGYVTATNSDGTGTSPTYFRVTGVAPTITSMTPAYGWSGSSVVIAGTGFTAASAVTFYNGQAATSYTVDSELQITATVPSGITTGALSVTNAWGTGSSGTNFENAYAADTFVDANGTGLASHTMDHGAGWTVANGSYTIQGDVATPGTSSVHNEAVVDVGHTDYTVEAVGHSTTSANRLAIFFRWGGADSSAWEAYWDCHAPALVLYENFANVKAEDETTLTYVADKDWHMKVVVSGTSVTFTVTQADNPSNTCTISYGSMASGLTNTKAGIDVYSTGTGAGFKSLVVYQ